MTIDIWSDIMCPFCYIGKRKLEKALEQFEQKSKVNIVWHSFQLDPAMEYQPGVTIHDYLADRKGQTKEWSIKVHAQMTENAKREGLEYNFDKAVIANSFDAHRLIQLAKTHGLGDAAEERLFKAYFTEGRNVSDMHTLVELGVEIGLDKAQVETALQTAAFAEQVHNDIERAEELGIRGVPFFVLDNKYGVSGAQPSEVFLQALNKTWQEHEQQNRIEAESGEAGVCTPDGDCKP